MSTDVMTTILYRIDQINSLSLRELNSKDLLAVQKQISDYENELKEDCRFTEWKTKQFRKDRDMASFEECINRMQLAERQLAALPAFRRRLRDIQREVLILERMNYLLGKPTAQILRIVVLVLIFLVLGILIYEAFHNYNLDTRVLLMLYIVDLAACSIFIFEFFVRMLVAEHKWWYLRKHFIDLVSSIPIPPIFPLGDTNTWFRVARAGRILRIYRGFRILSILWRGINRIEHRANVKILKRSVFVVLILIVVGGCAMHFIEGRVPSNNVYVTQLGQSIWWSFNTVAIGGYADLHKPQFMLTQIITALLLVIGLVVWGAFIATLTTLYRGPEHELLSDRVAALETHMAKATKGSEST